MIKPSHIVQARPWILVLGYSPVCPELPQSHHCKNVKAVNLENSLEISSNCVCYTTSILGCLDTTRHCNSTKIEYYGQCIEWETVVKLENDNIVTADVSHFNFGILEIVFWVSSKIHIQAKMKKVFICKRYCVYLQLLCWKTLCWFAK